ncbi:MAG: hypothetical protein U7127_24265 [Phormidium sp.]
MSKPIGDRNFGELTEDDIWCRYSPKMLHGGGEISDLGTRRFMQRQDNLFP